MTKEQVILFINTLDELTIFYNGNANKVATWITTENPNLGGSKPIDFFRKDKGQKVLNYVKHAVEQNNINGDGSTVDNSGIETIERELMEEGFQRAVNQLRKSYEPKLETALGAPSALAWASYLESMKDEVLK